MDLKLLCKRLNEYAHTGIACDWDNVGLLTEPSEPLIVKKMLLTNDLTEPVLEEALKKEVNMIVSYHPAIFRPLKRLTQADWKERSIVKCIEQRIAVYSPHTSWDSIDGGINDWILEAFETKKIESVESISSLNHPSGFSKNVKINLPSDTNKDILLKKLNVNDNIRLVSEKNLGQEVEVEFLTSPKGVTSLMESIRSVYQSQDNIFDSLRIINMEKPFMKNVGLGRLGYLAQPLKIRDVVDKLKDLFKMKTFRLALANGKTLDSEVKVLAVGAGSASKLLNNVNADLIITGEFAHHEILHETHRGVSLIVTDHSNTERGYRECFKRKFTDLLKKYNENVEILISEVDRDPLEYI
ncbi:unnamed protein product [Brachionus calyciflorus]|uniref:NIF3-like protein 1 n=1 Tax=Brachionus calyciflorus TaxID=104777 RepID=A0A813MK76_9BILA|nr:unnamed protein product [Brachionus calyciflorus]